MNGSRVRQRGFTIVTTIFNIVVLALLAMFMTTISSTQRATSTFSILGARAFFAAQSGMEWAAATVMNTGACFANPTSFTLAGGATSGFDVRLECTATPISEAGANYQVYLLRATASRGQADKEDYFSRTIEATVTDGP
jgi:MSHA biogenesis protein MshP